MDAWAVLGWLDCVRVWSLYYLIVLGGCTDGYTRVFAGSKLSSEDRCTAYSLIRQAFDAPNSQRTR
jgi:hypothetical protein